VNYQTGSWTDVPGFTNISTYSPTPQIGVLTVPLHGNVGAMIVGTSGTVRALPSGWLGDSGISWNFQLSVGGSQLKQYASTPASVWNDWLNEVKPDLVIINAKDTAEPELTAALKTIQGYINADAPNADTLYVGAYSQQSGPSTDMNDIFQAEANDTSDGASKVYWNADPVIGDWATASANGWFADSTHLSGTGRTVLGQAWTNDFGYFQTVPEPPVVTMAMIGCVLAYGIRRFVVSAKPPLQTVARRLS
jgi:hypothetical protein